MSKHRCQYKGCSTTDGVTNCKKSFFRFPKDNERSLDWILHSGNDSLIELPLDKLRDRRICSDHFSDDAFTNALRKKLVHNACPVMYETKCNKK